MLSSEFCTVQVLEGPKKLSASRNNKVSAFGSILKYCINGASTRTVSGGRIKLDGHYWGWSIKGGSTVHTILSADGYVVDKRVYT